MVNNNNKVEKAEICAAILITESAGVPVSHHLSACFVQGAGMMNLP